MMLKGKGYWMKVIKPVENYNKDGDEWSFDVTLDDQSKAAYLKEGGFKGYIRNVGDERGDFLSFKRGTVNRKGEKSPAYRIVGPDAKPWDGRMIGNGSEIRVKYLLNEVTTGRNKGKLKPSALSIQIWELVEYGNGDDEDFEVKQDVDVNPDDLVWATEEDEAA